MCMCECASLCVGGRFRCMGAAEESDSVVLREDADVTARGGEAFFY